MGSITRFAYRQLWEQAEKTGELKLYPETIKQLYKKEFQPIRWIVDDLIPAGGVTIMSGYASSFKTWLFMEMAVKVAKGESVFGKFNTIQSGILIIDEESGEQMLHDRLKQMQASEDLPITYLSRLGYKMKQLYVDGIARICREVGAKLVIFDSLVRFSTGDENVSKDMAELMDNFRQLADEGISVLIIHHNRKPAGKGKSNPMVDMRGSSDIMAAIDCHMGVVRNGTSQYVTVTQTKNRYKQEILPFELMLEQDAPSFSYVGNTQTKADERKEQMDAVKEIVEAYPGKSQTELIALCQELEVGAGERKLRDYLGEMVERGDLRIEKVGNNKYLYYLSENSNEVSLAESQ